MVVDLCAPGYTDRAIGLPVKGAAKRVLINRQSNGLSDIAVHCQDFNAVHVAVYAGGTSPSATISVEGSDEAGGNYLPLPDPQASQAMTANDAFECIVGTVWVKIRLANYVAGTFTIIVTPFNSPGQSQIQITNTASQNLAQYVGSTVGPTNPVDVRETDGDYATPTHTAVNVTTASGAVLVSNSSRLYALLVNDSDTDIYIKIGATAVANQGIRLNALGGSYEISRPGGNLNTGTVNAIHAGTGNKVLTCLEGT